MLERTGEVTLLGNPVTLLGALPEIGGRMPDAVLAGNDMKPVMLAMLAKKATVVLTVPSLDTPVCDIEGQTFNRRAVELGPDVAVVLVSMDLPFAQARWCGAHAADRVTTLSAHAAEAFGTGWGVLIKDVRLLARAVFVFDGGGILRHRELVPEIGSEPDYEAALKAVSGILNG